MGCAEMLDASIFKRVQIALCTKLHSVQLEIIFFQKSLKKCVNCTDSTHLTFILDLERQKKIGVFLNEKRLKVYGSENLNQ